MKHLNDIIQTAPADGVTLAALLAGKHHAQAHAAVDDDSKAQWAVEARHGGALMLTPVLKPFNALRWTKVGAGVARMVGRDGKDGFVLVPAQNARVPAWLRREDGFYPTGALCAAVTCAVPDAFAAGVVEAAQVSLLMSAPDLAEKLGFCH